MIRVFAQRKIKKENLEEALNLIKEMVKQTTTENDYIYYEAFQDENNKTIITFLEKWESKAALERHMLTKHFKEIIPMLDKLTEKDGPLYIFENPIK